MINSSGARSRRDLLVAALCGSLIGASAIATDASAQAYPTKPVRVIVATGTGTVSDLVARLIGPVMGKSLGQSFVVENLPAAGGVAGTDQLVRSPKDGHTLGVLNNNHVINPSVYKSIPYDTLADIAPISVIGSTPLVLVASPAKKIKTVQELLASAKAKPGAMTYGSAGNGTVLHLAGVLLTSEGKVDIRHIPYKGSSQMVTDVLAGRVDVVFLGVASATSYIASGQLVPIAVSSKVRSEILKDVPTFAEQGLTNYDFRGWIALAGPAGLPRPIVERLSKELKAALETAEIKTAFLKLGVVAEAGTPEEAVSFFKVELEKHRQLAERGGATLD